MTAGECLSNGGKARQGIVLLLGLLDAVLALRPQACDHFRAREKRPTSPIRHLVAEQDSHPFQRLPLAVQVQQGPDLKVARRHVPLTCLREKAAGGSEDSIIASIVQDGRKFCGHGRRKFPSKVSF
jgi:hypothetical protein